ncbi:MAG: efflux RND transporter permease subunit [Acidobacteriota bacterium]
MDQQSSSWINRIIWFSLEKRIVILLAAALLIGGGMVVAPFDWDLWGLPRYHIPVDAIPDIGENQQIVYTEWDGRSPRDVEDQITYPLTASLLGVPGVKTIRGSSMFGFSNIYVIFNDDIDFYWSRSRVLERLNSLPPGTLPEGVRPALGPDATALGQVMWYVLEGQDAQGKPTGGWDLNELRTIQDWYVRYALLSAEGVSEVASVGGFVQEYQIDVDPDRMRSFDVKLEEVVAAVRRSNIDVGARTLEINKVEYIIRGLGLVKTLEDLESALIKVTDNTPILVRHVATVTHGPAFRRGALDKGGAETVGGVVVARHGANPLATLKNVKARIQEISPALPTKTLADGTVSQVKVVPLYDRSRLIHETLATLTDAISGEMLVVIIVIVLLVLHVESSILVSSVLPLAVLLSFVGMKTFGVDANILALAGIAIAIGTLDDMGIVICESILRHLRGSDAGESKIRVVYRGAASVGGAVLTAASTTVISFLPVFALEGPEGKLFRPLAFTKTFALVGSALIAVIIIPPLAYLLFRRNDEKRGVRSVFHEVLLYLGLLVGVFYSWRLGLLVAVIGGFRLVFAWFPGRLRRWSQPLSSALIAVLVAFLLARCWLPLGPKQGLSSNFLFVSILIVGLLGVFWLLQHRYARLLGWCLENKALFMVLPLAMLLLATVIWLGLAPFYGWLPDFLKSSRPVTYLADRFPGLGKEFMPPLDEGSYLYMPVTMPHASIGEALDIVQTQDRALEALPEVESALGKLGRAESALDPAPASMIETLINYRSEFLTDENGRLLTFRYLPDETDLFRNESGEPVKALDGKPYIVRGRFVRDKSRRLIPDPSGKPFRVWRPALDPALNPGRRPWKGVQEADDIWEAIVEAATVPGITLAPRLQPISARIVMLQSGIRASMGVRVQAPDLKSIEKASIQLEKYLREVPSIRPGSVVADRIIGKPYLEIKIDRLAIAQYAIDLQQVQDMIAVAVGGSQITRSVEGRERYPIRVRYMRELRDDLESLGDVLIPTQTGSQIPLRQLAEIQYVRGPEALRTENTFLVGYVLFDRKSDQAEVDVVEQAKRYLDFKRQSGELQLPPGASFSFTGNYLNHERAEKKLLLIVPFALVLIFIIMYLQFSSVSTTLLVFSSIPAAWAGGFIMMWLYGQPWFLDFTVMGTSLRELFQVHPINLSVAVWVGFLALFGIAADDNIVMATYLEERFQERRPETAAEIQSTTIEAGVARIRPCLMTTATTILALLPVLTSRGRGSDVMVPMAIPAFGGLIFEVITMFTLPVLYSGIKEMRAKFAKPRSLESAEEPEPALTLNG